MLEQQFAKLKGDTDYRLNAIEGGAGACRCRGRRAGPQGGPPPASGDDQVAAPFGPQGRKPAGGKAPARRHDGRRGGRRRAGSGRRAAAPPPALAKTGDPAEDGYMLGYSLWSQKRYADAETQLTQVVAKYPKSKRASYAQNLLGRAYLDDGQLRDAAKAFYASYKQFPRGDRAPDSLYYLGQTLVRLKKNADACQAYGEFQDVYGATANATLKARVAQGRADAKCGWGLSGRLSTHARGGRFSQNADRPDGSTLLRSRRDACCPGIDRARLGIAFSGGPDSLALLTACGRRAGPVAAMTVDHGLRDGQRQRSHRGGASRRGDRRPARDRPRLGRAGRRRRAGRGAPRALCRARRMGGGRRPRRRSSPRIMPTTRPRPC